MANSEYELCTHCGQIIEEYGRKKDKVCKRCYNRIVNCKSRGVKYVKIVDMSAEEQKKYINDKIKENKNVISENFTKDGIEDANYSKNSDLVNNDIKQCLSSKGIKFPLEFNSLVPVFSILKSTLENYSTYIKDFLNAEDILNRMELDYKHAKEHYSSLYNEMKDNPEVSYLEKEKVWERKNDWEDRHNILLAYRREIKNIIAEYNKGGQFFIDLANDKEFMKLFNDYYNNLTRISEYISDGNYKAEVSRLVESEDFCLGFKNNFENKSRYNVYIKTRYNGSVSGFNRIVYAENEEDAKQQVIDFIDSNRDKFRFTWKSNEVFVQKLEPETTPRKS